jgi:hypothetical protein
MRKLVSLWIDKKLIQSLKKEAKEKNLSTSRLLEKILIKELIEGEEK